MGFAEDYGLCDYDGEDILSGDTLDYTYVSILKETEKAYLVNFGSKGSSWI